MVADHKLQLRTKFELSCPDSLWRIVHECPCKVPLYATDHVVARSLPAFTDDTERVVLHDRRAADPSKQSLLHAAVEAKNGYFW